VNVAVAGNMGSGKSTLIGVLSTGQYDNGKGSARTQVLMMMMMMMMMMHVIMLVTIMI